MKTVLIKKNSKKIKISFSEKKLNVFGPLGELSYEFKNTNIYKDKYIFIKNIKNISFIKKKINNLILSVMKGWFVELNLNGVGYKCFKNPKKNGITFDLGYSALIDFIPTKKLQIKILKNKILLFSLEKDYLYNVAFFIRNFVKLNPYKGKGILYKNQVIKLKKKNK